MYNIFLVGYITLNPTTYEVAESNGFVPVILELVGGVSVDSAVEVRYVSRTTNCTVCE